MPFYDPLHLRNFVRESNRIEGITRSPTKTEISAHETFLALESPTVADLIAFVWKVARQPIREFEGMDVRVGNHIAPRGHPSIPGHVGYILDNMKEGRADAYTTHLAYETLHPFMDGNGRSGRVLWFWQMLRSNDHAVMRRGFLHTFYYQTLSAIPKRNSTVGEA